MTIDELVTQIEKLLDAAVVEDGIEYSVCVKDKRLQLRVVSHGSAFFLLGVAATVRCTAERHLGLHTRG